MRYKIPHHHSSKDLGKSVLPQLHLKLKTFPTLKENFVHIAELSLHLLDIANVFRRV